MKLQIAAIILIGLFSYHNALSAGFVFDDVVTVVGNPYLGNTQYLGYLLSGHWGRAIGYLTYFLNFQLFGLNPFSYHLVNVIIHLLNALLVYYFVRLILTTFKKPKNDPVDGWLPLIVSLLFVSHPLQTQAVTYISQRFTLLAAFFYLSSLVFYVRSRIYPARFYINIIISLLFALCAMLSKEISFTLPLAVLFLELFFFTKQNRFMRSVIRISPFFIIAGVLLVVLTFHPQNSATFTGVFVLPSMRQGLDISRTQYAITQIPVVTRYIQLLIIPINQTVDYDFPLINNFTESRVIFGVALLLSMAVIIFLLRSSYRLISFGFVLFMVTLLVESSVIPIADVIFEHRVYLPSVGFFIAEAAAVMYVSDKIKGRKLFAKGFVVIIILILMIYSLATMARNKVWQNEYTLWKDAVYKSPGKARVHYNLGVAAADEGIWDEAKEEFEKTIELEPRYVKAYQNLAYIYKREGDAKNASEMQNLLDQLTNRR